MKTNKFMKVFVYVLVACLLLVGGGVLSACDPNGEPSDNHTHQWAEKYSYDDEYHYYECTVEGCDQHTGTELHEYDDDQDATCNKCDYERHVHTLTWKWDEDPNGNHWKEYACEHHADEKLELGKHDFSGENPNVCKVCGYDKTPPHTHHEVTKYDENQHWTSYDCEEHKDEKINPQDHTYNNDPNHEKCDGCDYNRGVEHEHSVSETWSNDATSHWKIYTCWHHDKEQLEKADHEWEYKADTNKDECKVCHYSVAHDHTKYQYTEKVDADQHWKSYTCHPNEKVDAASHNFGEEDAEACSCGLEHIYLDVYALYSANQTYVGNEADAFGDWYEAVKAEENFDHVALNAVGDAVFYYKKAAVAADDDSPEVEYDEVVKYFAPRTYIIKASAGTPAKGIESVWFTVKATVGGEVQSIADGKTVLDAQMTGSNGTVKLTFTPVWGYSSTSGEKIIAYTVNIAGEGEYQGPYAMPNNYLYSGAGKALTVNAIAPSDTAAAQTFTLTKCLGLGQQGMLENVRVEGYKYNGSTAYTAKLAKGLTDGWYKLDYVTTTKGRIGSFSLKIDNDSKSYSPTIITSGNVDKGGGVAYFMLYLTSENKELKFENQIGEHVANMTLTKHSDSLDLSQTAVIIATGASEQHKVVYNIKSGSIKAGRYYVLLGGSSVSAKFDGGEAVPAGKFKAITLKGTEKTVEFSSTSSLTVTDFQIVPVLDYPKEGPATAVFDENNSLFIYSWTAPKTAPYRLVLHSDEQLKQLYLINEITYFIDQSTAFYEEEGGYQRAYYLSATAETEYFFQVKNGTTEYPTTQFSIEEQENIAIEPGKDITVKYDALHTRKYLEGKFEPGLYAVTCQSEQEFKNVYLYYYEVGADGKKSKQNTVYMAPITGNNYASNLMYVTEDYINEGKVDLSFYSTYNYGTTMQKDETASVKLKFVKIADADTNKVTLGGAAFDATFSNDNIYAFEFTPEVSGVANIHLKSDGDLRYVKMLYCNITNAVSSPVKIDNLQTAVADETKERDQSTSSISGGTRYIVVLIYENATHFTEKVNVAVKKALDKAVIKADPGYYLRTGIGFNPVNNATKYELYEAVVNPDAPKPLVGDPAYKLVQTFTSADLEARKYETPNSDKKFNYINNTEAESKYFYYYVVASGAEDYATSTSAIVSGGTTGYSNHARNKYQVKLVIPQELVDQKATFYISIRGYDNTTTTNYVYGYAFVTPTKTEETFTVLSITPPSAPYTVADLTGTYDWEYKAYHYTSDVKVGTDAANAATLEAFKNAAITATVKFPENYVAKSNGSIYAYLYKGDTKVGSGISISLKKEALEQLEYTLKFYANEVTEADKDNYYIGFSDSNNILNEGYVLPDKVKVSFDDARMIGTATVNFADRCETTLKFTLPDNLMATSSSKITVNAYVQHEDGTVETTSFMTKSVTPKANDKSAEVKMYLPVGYTFTFKVAMYSGYTVDDVTNVKIESNKAKEVPINVNDHIDVTVTVTAPEGIIAGTTSIQVYLYEAKDGQPIDPSKSYTSSTVSFAKGDTSKELHLYAPLSMKEIVIGGSTGYYNTANTYPYCWSDYAKVTVEGNKGTVTFALETSYVINLTAPEEYVSYYSDSIYVYQDGEQIYYTTKAFTSTASTRTLKVYIPNKLYNADAKYVVYASLSASSPKGWSCAEKEFTFDAETKTANVTMDYKKDQTIKVTIKFPEGFELDTNNYTLELYRTGGTSTSAFKSWTLKPADITAGLKDNAYSYDLEGSAWLNTSYYLLTGNNIGKQTGTSNFKAYYCAATTATWDESAGAYVLTIEIKATPQVELTVVTPEDMHSTNSNVQFVLYLYDKEGKTLNSWSSTDKLIIPEGETNTTIKLYTTIVDPDVIKEMYGTVSSIYWTFSLTPVNNYYGKVTITPNGSSYSIKVEFIKKEHSFKLHFKDIPVDLNTGVQTTLNCYVYEKGEGGERVEGYTLRLPYASSLHGEEWTFTFYSHIWDEGQYELKLDFSSSGNKEVYSISLDVKKAPDGSDYEYDVTVTITQKETA